VHLKIINIAVLKNVLLKISICYEVLYIYVTNITKTNHLATRAINGLMDQDVQNPGPARAIDGIMDQDVQNPGPARAIDGIMDQDVQNPGPARAIDGIMDQDVQNPDPARSIDGIMDQDVQNPVPDSGKAQICGVVTPVIRIPTTHI
jgi:hypothetical protein